MGNSLKWSGVALAVIAGLLLGFALTTFAYRHRILRLPGRHDFVDRLDQALKLTPDQLHQVQNLVRDTHVKMRDLHRESRRQHRQLILDTREKIRALLTPEQQEKFDRQFSGLGGEGRGGRDGPDRDD